jgi:2-oxoacid:acceptor oxidoreductase delta subunit (pyruvate/2-ketoisovalerate family)
MDMKFKTQYEGPRSEGTKLYVVNTGEWRFERPQTNVYKCCHCGTCYLFCPTGCVIDKGTYFAADLNYCKGCGVCVNLCPVASIKMVREDQSED